MHTPRDESPIGFDQASDVLSLLGEAIASDKQAPGTPEGQRSHISRMLNDSRHLLVKAARGEAVRGDVDDYLRRYDLCVYGRHFTDACTERCRVAATASVLHAAAA